MLGKLRYLQVKYYLTIKILGNKKIRIPIYVVNVCLVSQIAITSPPVCLEANKDYKVKINFQRYNNKTLNPSASILVDSVSIKNI